MHYGQQAIVLLQIAKNAAAPDEPGAVKEFNGAVDAMPKGEGGSASLLQNNSLLVVTQYRILCQSNILVGRVLLQIVRWLVDRDSSCHPAKTRVSNGQCHGHIFVTGHIFRTT